MKTPCTKNELNSFEVYGVGLVRRKPLSAILGISVAATYLKNNPRSQYYDKNFPKPVRIGPNSVAWKMNEVIEYINSLERV